MKLRGTKLAVFHSFLGHSFLGLGVAVISLMAADAVSADDKTLLYCSEGSPEGFDPAAYTAGTTIDAARQMFDKLIAFEPGTTNVVPGLAERWDVSDDGLEYVFHLRQGVSFHENEHFTPTRDFNADDVIFSFARQGDPENPYYDLSRGLYEYYQSMSMGELIDRFERIDDHTVKLVLKQPAAPMISNLGMDFASIQSKEYADAMLKAGTPELLDLAPIGTGPFMFVDYREDAVVRYRANENYWRGAPEIDNLVFSITPDPTVRFEKLKAGECHVMPFPKPADIQAMKSHPEIELLQQEGLNIGYLAYNTQIAPFDDVRVRKALNMAINKDDILEVVYQGSGTKATNPIPPKVWSYNDAVQDDPYDPKAARDLLADAGIDDLAIKLWAMPVQRSYNPNARRMAELVQADWAEIGVETEIVTFEWGEYLERARDIDRDGALFLGTTSDNGDPDNILGRLLGCDGVGGSNVAQWCNPEYDALIERAKVEIDHGKRVELYQQAQTVFKENAPWATIAHSVVYKPVRKEVENFKIDPFGFHNFYGVDLAGQG